MTTSGISKKILQDANTWQIHKESHGKSTNAFEKHHKMFPTMAYDMNTWMDKELQDMASCENCRLVKNKYKNKITLPHNDSAQCQCHAQER